MAAGTSVRDSANRRCPGVAGFAWREVPLVTKLEFALTARYGVKLARVETSVWNKDVLKERNCRFARRGLAQDDG